MDAAQKASRTHLRPLLNSIPSVAAQLGVSRSKVYLLIADGKLAAVKIDGRTLVPEDSLTAFVAALPSASIGHQVA